MGSFPEARSLFKYVTMTDFFHALGSHSSQTKFGPAPLSRTTVVLSDAPSIPEMVAFSLWFFLRKRFMGSSMKRHSAAGRSCMRPRSSAWAGPIREVSGSIGVDALCSAQKSL